MTQNLLPKDFLAKLNENVVGQFQAKHALATAAFIHSNPKRTRSARVLISGPSGTGKTAMARELARILNRPFVSVNITEYTQSGYHGRSISEISDLIIKAVDTFNGNTETSTNTFFLNRTILTPNTNETEALLKLIVQILNDHPVFFRKVVNTLRNFPIYGIFVHWYTSDDYLNEMGDRYSELTGIDLKSPELFNIMRFLMHCTLNIGAIIVDKTVYRAIKKYAKKNKRAISLFLEELYYIGHQTNLLIVSEYQKRPEAPEFSFISSKMKGQGNSENFNAKRIKDTLTPIELLTKPKTAKLIEKIVVKMTPKKIEQLSRDGVLVHTCGVPINEIITDEVMSVYCDINGSTPSEELRKNLLVISHTLIRPLAEWINDFGKNTLYGSKYSQRVFPLGLYSNDLEDFNLVKMTAYADSWGLKKATEKDHNPKLNYYKEIDKIVINISKETMEPIVEETKEKPTENGVTKNTAAYEDCIVFIDEFDKIAASDYSNSKENVGRAGVQRDLLGILDGTELSSAEKKGNIFMMSAPDTDKKINSEKILFICAGAFVNESMEGIINELKGRFNLVTRTHELKEEEYSSLLDKEFNAIVADYDLSRINCSITLNEDVREAVVKKTLALNKLYDNLGVRRLKGLLSALVSDKAHDIAHDTKIVITLEDVNKLRITDIGFSDTIDKVNIGFV